MKVLAVTGRLAQDLVREAATGADVLVLDVDVAAFVTPEMLRRAAPAGYDLILLPGAITADFHSLEAELGTKIRLGPKHAVDLGVILRNLDKIELSRSTPACVLLDERMKGEARAALDGLEAGAEPTFSIGEVKVGGGARMKVLAEIVDATRLGLKELQERVRYYLREGADMIDLGLPLDAEPDRVIKAVKAAKEVADLPLSVDTVEPDLIRAGLEAGADLVLSLNAHNLPLVGESLAEAGVPAVVIPGPGSIEENLKAAQALGIETIADPVLSPPMQGLAVSLERYLRFREAHPSVPLFFGVGNVTELIDADSQGTNAIMAALAAEVDASILFTPEYSDKARGSVRELRVASEMMVLARARRSPPKDLGIDLLLAKEKRRRPEYKALGPAIEASSGHRYEMDPAGCFRIGIAEGRIWAKHEMLEVVSTSARDLLNTLIDRELVTRLDHAGYLGRELQKAELALCLKRSYCQDEPLLPEKD